MSEARYKTDVLVVGAGPAGIAAACTAASTGRRVTLVDDTPWLGGQIWRGEQARPRNAQAAKWITRLKTSGAQLLDRTSIIAAPGLGLLLGERNEAPMEFEWNKLIIATGARELFLPFPGWTLPGVMGPGGLLSLVKNGWPISGKTVAIAGSGPLLLATAAGLQHYGAKVISISEQAPFSRLCSFSLQLAFSPSKMLQAAALKLSLLKVPYHTGCWPMKAEAAHELLRITLTDGKTTRTEECDLFACGFGLVPNVELPLALGCELTADFVKVDRFQQTSVQNVYCAGEPTGIGGADCALVEGQIAGLAASGKPEKAEVLFQQRSSWHRFRAALAESFALRPELKTLGKQETIMCRCEDVLLGNVRQFASWREAKLQSRCGMGACQGRICGAAAKFILGWGMESVRPPLLPARLGSLVSRGP
jgi:NADPH-dependent 2,4-dienoyl-CoA reductase/sulfur reductase-like enzyme